MTEQTKCSDKKLCDKEDCKKCFDKSFASNEKAKYWSNKNELKPRQVFKSSGKKYLFNCDCEHQFEISLNNIFGGQWCSYCCIPTQKLCNKEKCKQCFEKSFASHEKSKFWSDKNKLKPRQITKSNGNKYLFNCDSCLHEFDIALNNVNAGKWCPYCVNKQLCDNINCKLCFEKSFASHEKAKYWSDKNKLKPQEVFLNSNTKYMFNCFCGHDFEQTIYGVNTGKWCSYCCIPTQKLCDKEDCKHCFERSFASHEKSKYWSNKNKNTSRQTTKGTDKKFIFDCECNHSFEISLCAISGQNNHWCSYCSNQKLCNNIECKVCFDKTFASQEKAKYWSNKNELKSNQIFKSTSKKFIFICENKHEFISSPNIISGGAWCPFCVNKTEQKLNEQLIKLYPTLQQQFKVNWCKKKTYLPFDFIIPEHNIIIELDGPQHFIQISNWSSPEEQNINDKYKMGCANKNNYSIIRLTQEDVFYDTYDWIDELNQNIQKIINEKIIQNIYMCKNNEYIVFDNQSDCIEV